MTSTRSAVLTAETTCITPDGHAGKLPPDVYAVVDIDGAAERGELYVYTNADQDRLVAISPVGVQIAEGARPFIGAEGHRPGMVVALCGHALAGTEWLAGYRICERCGSARSDTDDYDSAADDGVRSFGADDRSDSEV